MESAYHGDLCKILLAEHLIVVVIPLEEMIITQLIYAFVGPECSLPNAQ
jgi:hypothetical protein